MPLRIATSQTTLATTYALGATDNLYVPVGISSLSSEGRSVTASAGGHTVFVSGSLFGLNGGIQLGTDLTDSGNRVVVNASGNVESMNTAINLSGRNATVINHGNITGGTSAVGMSGALNSTDMMLLKNYGTITGNDGIFIGSGTMTINNYGSITSTGSAANTAIYTDAGNDVVRNRGSIDGTVRLFDGNDLLINRGTITGKVFMEVGNDVLDNRRGGIIDGDIDMGAGDDTFKPGTDSETASGGAGIDTLDFSGSGTVQLALDRSLAATGAASDDLYGTFENIIGSKIGANVLIGDSADNALTGGDLNDTLSGLGGADRLISGLGNDTLLGGADKDLLNGGDGADRLTGGSGEDTLTGGGGADLFLFGPGDFSGITRNTSDYIADFNRASGDKINLAAVDAKASTATNDAFTFIGTAAFHNVAGELRITFVETGFGFFDTLILGDTNGDGTADFGITLASQITLLATDFVL